MAEEYKKLIDREKVKAFVLANKKALKLAAILIAVMMLTSHIKGCQMAMRKTPVQARPVQTGVAVTKDVPVYLESFGTLYSLNNVDVQSQVTGKILEVNYTEGTEVAAGDRLFTIDPSEYKAQVDKAQASLEQDIVTRKLKMDTLERNRQLFESGLLSQQDYDGYQTDAAAAEAQVQLDKANVELAQINLGYCYIASPIDGLAGKRQVDVGNIVSANAGPILVNVKSMDPLYIDFTLPEKDLSAVRDAMAKGTLEVYVKVDGDDGGPYKGELQFVDNTVDDATGTIFLRGKVSNGERRLWPGQFVQVRLILSIQKDAVLVPYQSVQMGQKGMYLFAVTKDDKADLRLLTAGQMQGDEIVIQKGVSVGEKVVVVGQLGLSPGVPVVDMTEKMKQETKKKGKKKK